MMRFAETNGFTVVGTSRNRMNVDVTGSVASIEEAFHVTMGVYQHPTENRTFYCSGPGAHAGPGGPAVAHLGPGQLFDPAARHLCIESSDGDGPTPLPAPALRRPFCGSDMRAAYYGGTSHRQPASRSGCWSMTAPIWPT